MKRIIIASSEIIAADVDGSQMQVRLRNGEVYKIGYLCSMDANEDMQEMRKNLLSKKRWIYLSGYWSIDQVNR